jgi:hypothetical protein
MLLQLPGAVPAGASPPPPPPPLPLLSLSGQSPAAAFSSNPLLQERPVPAAGASGSDSRLASPQLQQASPSFFSFSNPMLGNAAGAAAAARKPLLQPLAASSPDNNGSEAASTFSGSNPMLARSAVRVPEPAPAEGSASSAAPEMWASKFSKSKGKAYFVRIQDGASAWALPAGAVLLVPKREQLQ